MMSSTDSASGGRSGERFMISALARISESGVRSSCEASATNVRWASIEAWIGLSARPASHQPPHAGQPEPGEAAAGEDDSSRRSACSSGSMLRPISR